MKDYCINLPSLSKSELSCLRHYMKLCFYLEKDELDRNFNNRSEDGVLILYKSFLMRTIGVDYFFGADELEGDFTFIFNRSNAEYLERIRDNMLSFVEFIKLIIKIKTVRDEYKRQYQNSIVRQ